MYRFQVLAFNYEGFKISNTATFIIATIPDKPPTKPVLDVSQSDGEKLKVSIGEFVTAQNGGADIVSYEIQIDDGNNGPFTTVVGGPESYTLDSEVLITDGIIKGKQYRLRYRAINLIGNGLWSDMTYVVASTYPKAPPKPVYTFVDNTKLDLILTETQDDGGSKILAYHLYINEGFDGTAYHKVSTYDGDSMVFTINAGDKFDSMTVTPGLTYTIKYVAQNVIGYSEDSDLLQVAIARPPLKPNMPTFDATRSTKTQITVLWQLGTSQDSPVTGYRLYSDLGLQGDFFMIYNGFGNINKLFYTHTGLTTGLTYSYKIEVLNFNGPSQQSEPNNRASCEVPSGFVNV